MPAARIARTSPLRSRVKEEGREVRRDDAHLRLIRRLPCAATGWMNTEAHHLVEGMSAEGRGMGRKAPDRWTIPLSPMVHAEIHRSGTPETYLLKTYGVRARELAEALWKASPDLSQMLRVMERQASWRVK